uniref:Uncharacterized protein n=2 Tax=Mesocestoides corti TaxID=53468 RepID=A0A5K3FXI0_MESCO
MNASNFPTSSCDPFYPFYLMTDAPECNIHPPPPPDVMPSPDVPGHWTATSVPPYDGFVPPQPPPRPTSHPSSFNPTAFAYAPVYPPEEGCFVGGGGGDASGATIESGYPLSTSSEQQSDHQTPFLKELSTAPSPTPAPAPPSNANAPADKLEPSPPTPIEDSAISSLLFASGETDAKPSGEQPKHQESLTAGEEFVTPTAVVSPQSQQVQPDVAAPPIANLLTSRKRRRQPFLETVQKYADKLQPVDCVIMIERCYPFSKNTRFMQYFKSHFLHKILSDLNGGHPLDTDYGRDCLN